MEWARFSPEAKKLKLYGYWRSSNSWRIRWALNLKKIDFNYVPVDILKGENQEPPHKARNSMGALPVLEINDGIFLSQSMAMLEWIEEVYTLSGPALFPGIPLERAKIRELCEIVNADTMPLQAPRIQKKYSPNLIDQKSWAAHFIREGLKSFDVTSRLCRKNFSFQDQITAADLCLVPIIYNGNRYGIDMPKEFPELWTIYERALKTDACFKASPEQQIDAPKTTN